MLYQARHNFSQSIKKNKGYKNATWKQQEDRAFSSFSKTVHFSDKISFPTKIKSIFIELKK